MPFEHLFKPIKIGSVEIKNRIAYAPMGEMYPDAKGEVTEQTLAYFAARAKGGAGLIIMGAVETNQWGWDTHYRSELYLGDNDYIPGMGRVADRVHAFDARVFIQLTPGLGRVGTMRKGVRPPSSSPVPYVLPEKEMARGLSVPGGQKGEVPKEMTIEEIIEMEDKMAQAGLRAKMAGMDGIEIHSTHGYLMAQFLSPRVNKRTDIYGGSLENRMRFLLNTINKTREMIGSDMVLGARLSIAEHVEGGLTFADTKGIAKKLEKAGCDYISVSDGMAGETPRYIFPNKDGTMLEGANGFKEVLEVPVMTPSIHDPQMAEEALSEGKTDMIALGRQLVIDPEWPNKVREGRINEIRRCKRDNLCLQIGLTRLIAARCPWNPESGREMYNPDFWQPPYTV